MPWRLAVLQTAPAGERYERDFLALAASLAAFSHHPAAADIRRAAKSLGLSDGPVSGFQDFPDRGFGGLVLLPGEKMPRAVLVGIQELLEESGLRIPDLLEVTFRRWAAQERLVLLGGWDGYVRGGMAFSGT